MKIIFGSRSSGKTEELIEASYKTGIPIVCVNKAHVNSIIKKSVKMGFNIPNPYTYYELVKSKPPLNGILIDDVDSLLKTIFKDQAGIDEIVAVTMTCDTINNLKGVVLSKE